MDNDPSRRFGLAGVKGLFGPSLESRERKKRINRRLKQELDAQIKYKADLKDKPYGGPYGDFLVDKISNSPAPVKESLIVPPLHRTVKDGHVEPWKKFDEEQFAVEQKRKLRWESFRDQHNIPSRKFGANDGGFNEVRDKNLEYGSNFARSPITHKALDIYSSGGVARKENLSIHDSFWNGRARDPVEYQRPLWEMDGNINVNRGAQVSPLGDQDKISSTSVSIDSCLQVQKAFHALDENRKGLLHKLEIKRLCSLYYIPIHEVELALQRSSSLSFSSKLIRYNVFLKNLCPTLFDREGNKGLQKGNASQMRRTRQQKIWHPWGGSGGGAPVVGSDGKPIADRTALRRNAGYRIQRGGLLSLDNGRANSPGSPMYLSGSLGKFFYVSDGNENKINGNGESKGSNEIGYAKRNGSKDVVGLKKSPIRANLNRHPISDFLDPFQNQDIETERPLFDKSVKNDYSYRPVRGRVKKNNNRRGQSIEERLRLEKKPQKLVATDIRFKDQDMIMRKVVQDHDPMPPVQVMPSSNSRMDQGRHSLSMMYSIPSNEMGDWPAGLTFQEENESVKEIFRSPFRGFTNTPSENGSLNSEQRENLLTNYSTIQKPLQKSFAFEPNASDSSYDKFLDAAKHSMFINTNS